MKLSYYAPKTENKFSELRCIFENNNTVNNYF